MWRVVSPTGTTRVAGVIGNPISHSLSPVLLNAAFAEAGLDWTYAAFAVADGAAGDAVGAMRALDLGGLSVTMPHKAAVIPHLDELSPTAQRLGAVNCIAWESSRLVGHSTDGAGLVDALRLDEGIEIEGRRCAVVGAGGAARAAVAGLADAGAAEVVVVNRTYERAEAASALAQGRGRAGETRDLAEAEVIVQATSVGMGSTNGADVPFDADLLSAGQVLIDMVYEPAVTPLIAAARDRGVRTVGGVGMLVHQAAHAFVRWTGESAPVEAMTAAANAALARR